MRPLTIPRLSRFRSQREVVLLRFGAHIPLSGADQTNKAVAAAQRDRHPLLGQLFWRASFGLYPLK